MTVDKKTAALDPGTVLYRRSDEPQPAARPSAGSAVAADARKPRRLRTLLIAALVFFGVSWAVATWVDGWGWRFFDTGKTLVVNLSQVAKALESGNFDAMASYYDDGYRGAALGLTELTLDDERDDVRTYRFASTSDDLDRSAAIDEWRAYASGFASIETAGLYIHRLEEWSDPENVVASVRLEIIGTPHGETRAGIDRGFARMRFAVTRGERGKSGTMRILSAEPIDGDRLISSRAHFVDVAPTAGIDFENKYYPAFLEENRDEPLVFNMLRYGPAGITAADVDNDGFYDLFIPDGEASRLYRNNHDGTFTDITAASGLTGLDGVSVGLFADFDNDGFKDFFVSRTFSPNQIYRNNGPDDSGTVTFTDVTEPSGIDADCCTTVASAGDYDNDGFLDLYVGRYLDPRLAIPTTFYARNGEPNQLYRNNGDGTFTNVTEETGVGEVGLCLGSVFGDYDDDGDVDLYVVNDFGRKTLYRNDGPDAGYTFTDVTVETGTLAYGAGMSASFGDYDNDQLLDIYVAHIRSEEGWFAETPTVLRYMFNTMRQGVWVSDMPLYMQILRQSGFGFVKVFQDMASGNTLLRNRGDGTFEDTTWAANANPPGWFWGSGFFDYDNDGWQDIYSANGWVYNDQDTEIELDFLNNVVSEMKEYKTGAFFDPNHFGSLSWHGWERNRHLRNEGPDANGFVSFTEVGRATGTDLLLNSRGTATADFWNRGVLDIAVAASTDRHALLRNDVAQARSWLAVELTGAADTLPDGSNRDAVGARVTVRTGDDVQMREIALGDGYGAQNTLRPHFGLGTPLDAPPVIDELTVRWPRSGREQRFTNVAANRVVALIEGQDALIEKTYAVRYDPSSEVEEHAQDQANDS